MPLNFITKGKIMKKIFIFTNTEQPFTINNITFKNNIRLEIKEEELENLRKNSYFRNIEGKAIKVIIREQAIEEDKKEVEVEEIKENKENNKTKRKNKGK